MKTEKILSHVARVERSSINIEWRKDSNNKIINNLEHYPREWHMLITNSPEVNIKALEYKHQDVPTLSHQFEISSLKEGVELCQELLLSKGLPFNLPNFLHVNTTKKMFIVIHVEYIVKQKT